jgi:hypothetical protein
VMEMTHASREPRSDVHPRGQAFHELRTWLRAAGSSAMLSTCSGPTLPVTGTALATPPGWPADALLLAVVEAGVRADFFHRSEGAGLDLDFYESTALARWSEGEHGPDLLDLVIEPRVGVHCDADVERARALFTEVASNCLIAHALRVPLTLKPTVEFWSARPVVAGGSARHD